MTSLNRKAYQGSVLVFAVVFLTSLIGFLGVASYLGINSWVQAELQNMTNSAALIGSSALYDNYTNYMNPSQAPQASEAEAAEAAVWARMANQSALKDSFSLTHSSAVDTSKDRVSVSGEAVIPTPLFSLIGINEFKVQALSSSRFVKAVYTSVPPIVKPSDSTPGNGTQTATALVQLRYPLIEGNGPDLKVVAANGGSGWQGYTVQVCDDTGTQCYDVTRGARSTDITQGIVLQVGGQPVIYGSVTIDIGLVGVYKGTQIKIVDDGVPDLLTVAGGIPSQSLEFYPQTLSISRIETYHHAINCPPSGSCPTDAQLSALGLASMRSGI